MKKLLIVLLATLTIYGCQKKDTPNVATTQDVEFGIVEVDPGLKGSDDILCPDDMSVDYAEIVIDGFTDPFYPLVFRLNGKLYTQAIKLPVGTYNVTKFLLKRDEGVIGDYTDDQVVMATPTSTSDYRFYVTKTTDFTFDVGEFTKTEVDVEVLCFLDVNYEKFGFNWFAITEIVIREYCFFGDFCMKHPADYLQSLYGTHQLPIGETAIDMAAIFEVRVFDITGVTAGDPGVEVHNSPFTNATDEAKYGVGSPLCVQFPDNLNIPGEQFRFELWIYVAVGNGFAYVPFKTWVVQEDGAGMFPDVDGDKVVDFVLGNCNFSGTDLQLAPYQNLPSKVQLNIQYPGILPSYWDIQVTNAIPNAGGYDFGNISTTKWLGWCGDQAHTIGQGTQWFNVYSSLRPSTWPIANPQLAGGAASVIEKVAKLNWLFNNLDQANTLLGLTGVNAVQVIEDFDQAIPVHHTAGDILQNVIWRIMNNTGGGTNVAAIAGLASGISSYTPLPGGYAAVFLVKDGAPTAQLLFVQVDP